MIWRNGVIKKNNTHELTNVFLEDIDEVFDENYPLLGFGILLNDFMAVIGNDNNKELQEKYYAMNELDELNLLSNVLDVIKEHYNRKEF